MRANAEAHAFNSLPATKFGHYQQSDQFYCRPVRARCPLASASLSLSAAHLVPLGAEFKFICPAAACDAKRSTQPPAECPVLSSSIARRRRSIDCRLPVLVIIRRRPIFARENKTKFARDKLLQCEKTSARETEANK